MAAVRKCIFVSIVLSFALASTAHAVPLTLEAPSTVIAQQTTQNPCIFGDPSCSNPVGFDFTLFPAGGGETSYDEASPLYTVDQLVTVANSTSFDIGIDVNTAQGAAGPEILEFFSVEVNGVEIYSFTNGVDGDGTLAFLNNGTGFSDSRLLTVDLAAFNGGDIVQFFVKISRATDGRENLFIISADAPGTPVPEPATALLLLPGLLLARRRRQ